MQVWNHMRELEKQEGSWDRARALMDYQLMMFNRAEMISRGAAALLKARLRMALRSQLAVA